MDPDHQRDRLADAIRAGDLKATKRLVESGAPVNDRRSSDGMTPLSRAAFHGEMEIVKYLLEQEARISADNRDGNTALHLAAFTCRVEMIEFLVSKGASIGKRNHRRESSIDVVSGEWSDGLGDFYEGVSRGAGLGLKVDDMKRLRPKIAKRLRELIDEQRKGRTS